MFSIDEKQLDELTASMISQMQEYIDEWRGYSESSIDMPANKADAKKSQKDITYRAKQVGKYNTKKRRSKIRW